MDKILDQYDFHVFYQFLCVYAQQEDTTWNLGDFGRIQWFTSRALSNVWWA